VLPILDRYLLKSFIGPFVITAFVAWFALLMQFLWFFIETIAGKGLSFFTVVELIGYRGVYLFPVSLPLACLIAAVMTVGGLAERHELSSFHSAGVSPGRVLLPLLLCGSLVAGGSYLIADYLIPASNLAFHQRLFEVQMSDAALNVEPGVFNDGIPGFTILAKEKTDEGVLKDVLLYDTRSAVANNLNIVSGQSGELTIDENTETAQLLLRNGSNYRERSTKSNSFMRTNFSSYRKRFSMSELSSPVLSNNGSHYSLLTSWQLQAAADSVAARMDSLTISFRESFIVPGPRSTASGGRPTANSSQGEIIPDSAQAFTRSRAAARRISFRARSLDEKLVLEREVYVQYTYRKHEKYSLAVACILFVLVGGGLGEVVRSGNFGFPVLISISIFVAYIMGSIFCRRLAESFVLHPVGAGWVPALATLIVGGLIVWWRGR